MTTLFTEIGKWTCIAGGIALAAAMILLLCAITYWLAWKAFHFAACAIQARKAWVQLKRLQYPFFGWVREQLRTGDHYVRGFRLSRSELIEAMEESDPKDTFDWREAAEEGDRIIARRRADEATAAIISTIGKGTP